MHVDLDFFKTQSRSINDVCFLLQVMAVTNDAEMVTLLVINGKEVKQDGWYSFRRFRKLDGHLFRTPPPPSRTAIIR